MKRRSHVLVPAILAASLAGQGMRTDPAEVWAFLSKTHDHDKNGEITAQEYGRGDDKFARFDRDQDGVITEADFERGSREGRRSRGDRGPRSERGDSGGRSSGRSQMIGFELAKRADTDRNGQIPAAEWSSFVAGMSPDEDGAIDRANLGLGGSGMMRSMVDRMVDADGDGAVTVEDLNRIRDSMDENGDGSLQRAELGTLPLPGEKAPDFVLPYADKKGETMTLSSFAGVKPVALIFGSYT